MCPALNNYICVAWFLPYFTVSTFSVKKFHERYLHIVCGGEKEANFYSTFFSLLKSQENEKTFEVTIFLLVFLLSHCTVETEYTFDS